METHEIRAFLPERRSWWLAVEKIPSSNRSDRDSQGKSVGFKRRKVTSSLVPWSLKEQRVLPGRANSVSLVMTPSKLCSHCPDMLSLQKVNRWNLTSPVVSTELQKVLKHRSTQPAPGKKNRCLNSWEVKSFQEVGEREEAKTFQSGQGTLRSWK